MPNRKNGLITRDGFRNKQSDMGDKGRIKGDKSRIKSLDAGYFFKHGVDLGSIGRALRDEVIRDQALLKRLNLTETCNTTPDMLFTVETVSCLGACGLAPVIVINEDVHGQMTPESALKLVDDIFLQENVN